MKQFSADPKVKIQMWVNSRLRRLWRSAGIDMLGCVSWGLTEFPTSIPDRRFFQLRCLLPPLKLGCPLSFVSHAFCISIHISGIMPGLLSGANYEHKKSRSTSHARSCAVCIHSFRFWMLLYTFLHQRHKTERDHPAASRLFGRFPSTLCSKNPTDSKILCCTTLRFLTWVHIIARDTEPQWQAVRVGAKPGVTVWAIKSYLFTATSTHLEGSQNLLNICCQHYSHLISVINTCDPPTTLLWPLPRKTHTYASLYVCIYYCLQMKEEGRSWLAFCSCLSVSKISHDVQYGF